MLGSAASFAADQAAKTVVEQVVASQASAHFAQVACA